MSSWSVVGSFVSLGMAKLDLFFKKFNISLQKPECNLGTDVLISPVQGMEVLSLVSAAGKTKPWLRIWRHEVLYSHNNPLVMVSKEHLSLTGTSQFLEQFLRLLKTFCCETIYAPRRTGLQLKWVSREMNFQSYLHNHKILSPTSRLWVAIKDSGWKLDCSKTKVLLLL